MRGPGDTGLSLDGNPPFGRVSPDAVGHYAGGFPPFGTSGTGHRPPPVGAVSHHRDYHLPDILLFTMWPKRSVQHDRRITEIKERLYVNLLWFRRQLILCINTAEHF